MPVIVGTVSNGKTTGSQASLTLAGHAVDAGSDRYLLVFVINWTNAITTSATYGGTPMTSLGGNAIGSYQVRALGLANPAVGTANVVITPSASTWIAAGAISLTGCIGPRPGSFVTGLAGSSPSSVVTTSAVGERVIDLIGSDGSNIVFTPEVGQTTLFAQNGQVNTDVKAASSVKAGATSVTMVWTMNFAPNGAMGALSLQPVGGGGGGGGGSVEPWQYVAAFPVTQVAPWQHARALASGEPWQRRGIVASASVAPWQRQYHSGQPLPVAQQVWGVS